MLAFPFPNLLEADMDTIMLLFMSCKGKQACGRDEFKLKVVRGAQETLMLVRLSLNSTVKL